MDTDRWEQVKEMELDAGKHAHDDGANAAAANAAANAANAWPAFIAALDRAIEVTP